jgi:hypothetical protein
MVVVGLVSACGSGTSVAPVGAPTPTPSPVARSASPTLVRGLDLHGVDWREAAMPGAACFQPRPIRLRHGQGAPYVRPGFTADSGKRTARLELATFNKNLFTFGDLEGGNTSDATVGLNCNNTGGMAGGALLYSVAVFSGRTGQPRLLGLLTPQVQHEDELPTLIDDVRITRGQITWVEAFYGGHDGTCCPSGEATTVWTYGRGQFGAHTTVTKHPASYE